MPAHDPALRAAQRWALAATSLCVGLAVALGLSLARGDDGPPDLQAVLASPELRAQLLDRIAGDTAGVWDTFPDPDVGRVLLGGLDEKAYRDTTVSSNAYGMRERPYALPKPAGTTRVAILGDSFVFGDKAPVEDRLGVFLEQYLRERAGAAEVGRIECLHLGLSSWNVLAQCAWLRRHLDLLRPDLVVHVTVRNDLADCTSARGFGGLAGHTVQRPEQKGSLISAGHQSVSRGWSTMGFLPWGIDHEGRARYERAEAEIRRLADEVERAGGKYLHLLNWDLFNRVARERLLDRLPPEQCAAISSEFWFDKANWVQDDDAHWGRRGHERVAKLLFALIEERDLLPALALEPWAEATEERRRIHDPGWADALLAPDYEARLQQIRIRSEIDFDALDGTVAGQIHGGVDPEGRLAPYASMTLFAGGGTRVRVAGRGLERPSIEGARVEVLVDELSAGWIDVPASGPFDATFALPSFDGPRPFVSLRLRATDWVYEGPELRTMAVLRLGRVAIE